MRPRPVPTSPRPVGLAFRQVAVDPVGNSTWLQCSRNQFASRRRARPRGRPNGIRLLVSLRWRTAACCEAVACWSGGVRLKATLFARSSRQETLRAEPIQMMLVSADQLFHPTGVARPDPALLSIRFTTNFAHGAGQQFGILHTTDAAPANGQSGDCARPGPGDLFVDPVPPGRRAAG